MHPGHSLLLSTAIFAVILPPSLHAQASRATAVDLAKFRATPAPRLHLKAALYLPEGFCEYKYRFNLSTVHAGKGLCPATTQQFEAAFETVLRVQQVPYAPKSGEADLVIALDPPMGRNYFAGMFNGETLTLTFTAYEPSGAVLLKSTEERSVKRMLNGDDWENGFAVLAADEVSTFLLKLKETQFIRAALQPPPKPVEPPPPQPAIIEISSSASVQVYINDEFKGTTSAEGRLVITLPAGQYKVRLSEPGKKEWAQPLQLAAGERRPLSAVLESAGPKPLTASEVEEALTNGVPKPRVKTLIRDYGVSFALTDEVERRLRKAGADDEILLAIVKNKK